MGSACSSQNPDTISAAPTKQLHQQNSSHSNVTTQQSSPSHAASTDKVAALGRDRQNLNGNGNNNLNLNHSPNDNSVSGNNTVRLDGNINKAAEDHNAVRKKPPPVSTAESTPVKKPSAASPSHQSNTAGNYIDIRHSASVRDPHGRNTRDLSAAPTTSKASPKSALKPQRLQQDLHMQNVSKLLNTDVVVRRDEQGRKWINHYECLETLGKGSYGKVKLCLNTKDNKLYAIKCVSRRVRVRGKGDVLANVLREVAIMRRLKHKNVVRLYEALSDEQNGIVFLVLEHMTGGAAMEGVARSKPLPLKKAHSYFRDALCAVEYLHHMDIVHRDIKPENLLVGSDGRIKISDFGVSEMVTKESDLITNTAGTPAFLAPECCRVGAFSGKASDMWALGVTLYYFSFGRIPFLASNLPEIYQKIKNDPVHFDENIHAPDELKQLITKMLQKDPTKRPNPVDCRSDKWVTQNGQFPLENILDEPPEEEEEDTTIQQQPAAPAAPAGGKEEKEEAPLLKKPDEPPKPESVPEELWQRSQVKRRTRMETMKGDLRKAAEALSQAVEYAEIARSYGNSGTNGPPEVGTLEAMAAFAAQYANVSKTAAAQQQQASPSAQQARLQQHSPTSFGQPPESPSMASESLPAEFVRREARTNTLRAANIAQATAPTRRKSRVSTLGAQMNNMYLEPTNIDEAIQEGPEASPKSPKLDIPNESFGAKLENMNAGNLMFKHGKSVEEPIVGRSRKCSF